MSMLYLLLILLVVFIAFLLSNIRVRFQLSDGRKLLFVGLGRSGPEFDFAGKTGSIKLFGMRIKSFEIGKHEKKRRKKAEKKTKRVLAAKPPKQPKRDRVSLWAFYRVGRKCVGPLWAYFVSLLKAVVVEEVEGQIEGGFDAPHVTGAVFGYYQAAVAVAPGVVGRVRFVPNWTGPSFSGAARMSVAMPVHQLLWRTIILTYRLPLRDLLKLAIGKKKGVSDVQQRR